MDRRTARDLVSVKRAFTLIELMVAILIISILFALVVPNFVLMQERARRSAVKNNMHVIQLGLEAFAIDHSGSYPTADAGSGGGPMPANPGGPFDGLTLWLPGGDPFGIDGEPKPGNMPINPYDGKRYNSDDKDVEDFDYEEFFGELESGQNARTRGDDEDCPYLEFGGVPEYPGGIGVATYVSEDAMETATQYGIYGFGRDVTYPMYDVDPEAIEPRDADHWVFFVLHN
jgi:prepilin-type N-terminal cleavage/methylation domain-containing protein